jgi:hypothetical protein
MRKFILVTAALLACASLAHADCTCSGVDNCLGVYFDQGQWTQTCLFPPPFQLFHMYFVLQNSVFDAIGGFEFSFRFDPPPSVAPIIVSAIFPVAIIDPPIDPFNVICGSPAPIPATGPVVVMDLTVLPLSSLVTNIELGPSTPASLPGHGAINDFYNPAHIVPINFPCPVGPDGWTIEPVAQLGQCVVAVESVTWSSIKSLYR